MVMASFVMGKPLMVKYGAPGSSYNAGDVVVVGGIPFVAHEDNPPFGTTTILDALAAFGGIYQMASDAAYANGIFVYWDSVLQQVTAQVGANRVPFGQIVGGPNLNLSDGGPTGAAGVCLVLHDPEPEMRFGSATFASGQFSSFGEEGNLYRNIGNPVAGNGADTTDDILDGIVLAANCFDLKGRGLYVLAQGKFAANGNNKRIKIWANPTMAGQTVTNGVISGGTVTGAGAGVLLFDSGVQTGNAVGWSMLGNWFKYGANGSNTQYFQGQPIFGTTHGGITVPAFTTIPENALINLVLTGSSPTTGAANDVVENLLQVNAMN
jgi:hypothetical protein